MITIKDLVEALNQVGAKYANDENGLSAESLVAAKNLQSLEINPTSSIMMQQIQLLGTLRNIFSKNKLDNNLINESLNAINHFAENYRYQVAEQNNNKDQVKINNLDKFTSDLKSYIQQHHHKPSHKSSNSSFASINKMTLNKINRFSHNVETTHKVRPAGEKMKQKYKNPWVRKRIYNDTYDILKDALKNDYIIAIIPSLEDEKVRTTIQEAATRLSGEELNNVVREIIEQEKEKLLREAIVEVIAQEFYRLIKPDQPKTRLVIDDDGNIFVVSKKIKNARSLLEEVSADHLTAIVNKYSPAFSGLGTISLVNLVVNQDDAKLGNIFFDEENGKFYEIDGDQCLMQVLKPNATLEGMDITASDINMLPFITDYKPGNWFDIFTHNANTNTTTHNFFGDIPAPNIVPLFERGFQNNVAYRKEINEAMLKILMLPEELIKKFVHSYVRDTWKVGSIANKAIEVFTDRIHTQLHTAALQSKSFQQYMQSEEAVMYREKSIQELLKFKSISKTFLLAGNETNFISGMNTKFNKLRVETNRLLNASITAARPQSVSSPRANTALPPIRSKSVSHERTGSIFSGIQNLWKQNKTSQVAPLPELPVKRSSAELKKTLHDVAEETPRSASEVPSLPDIRKKR